MKIPTSPEELKFEIELSSKQPGDLRIRQLIKILSIVDDKIIVEGVFRTIEDESSCYEIQKYAGRIIREVNPKSKKDSKEYLIRILKNWDKSCEEIPFWMKKNWGIESLRYTIAEIENNEKSKVESDNLKAFKWWLNIK